MKHLHILAWLVALGWAVGCGKSEQPSSPATTPPAAATTNQPESVGATLEKYGRTMATVKKSSQIKVDLISVNQAILAFEADRGRHPEKLDELIQEGFLPRLPDLPAGKKYSYDAQTGQVTVVDGN